MDATTLEEPQPAVQSGHGIKAVRACTINQPVEALYNFWRTLENLPLVMKNLVSVTPISSTRSHWVARGARGKTIEWDALIINEHPNELIAWKTAENSDVAHAGSVRFRPAPGGRGTEVVVTFEYDPMHFDLKIFSRLFGKKPADTLGADLYRFKALMETGEAPTNEGQSAGAGQKEEAA
ncbi:MAG TPA: SRPBCC family protein [Verrucomicrobiae bacterium]|jgi:uncharacterized membrane protein|nr:SRPBCC family protein [Verrucomicrobiae bacterium]